MCTHVLDRNTGTVPETTDHFASPSPTDRCPCLSGEVFAACCGRFLSGAADAPTAEQLMRSRYTAFVVGDAEYLLATWHPSTRPDDLELDPTLRWLRLDVLRRERGGPLDRDGIVEFRALYRHEGVRGEQHEESAFRREGGRWRYLSGRS
jgi:SEC-C motif-containing protein